MKPHAAEEAAEAAIEATPAVDDAAAATAAAAKVAADAATKAAADAAAATQAAARAAADAAAAVTTAATETTAAATTEAVTAATAMADDTMALLDPANFDATKINAMIEASELTSVVKATLKSGVDAAAAELQRSQRLWLRSKPPWACNRPQNHKSRARQPLRGFFHV